MAGLAFGRSGAGPPLVLLHALGSSRHSWDPVVPRLGVRFDVLAVDLPGFGESVPLPVEPSPAALAAAVAGLLDELGIASPHVAGNSIGGWVALELAHIRPVSSLTLLAPAGLWRRDTPLYDRLTLRASRWLTRHAARPLSRVVDRPLGRALVLGQTHGRPTRLTPDYAREAIRELGTCPGFDAVFKATLWRQYRARGPIDGPVTVGFGTRDRVLLRHQSRHLDELPAGTHVAALPGCGHLPVADDPLAVAALITATAGRTSR